jgi:hypothetical protein
LIRALIKEIVDSSSNHFTGRLPNSFETFVTLKRIFGFVMSPERRKSLMI